MSGLQELDESTAAVFAAGAASLKLHPIETSGSAHAQSADAILKDDSATVFHVVAHRLQVEHATRRAVAIDVLHRDTAVAPPSLLQAHDKPATSHLAQLLSVPVPDFPGSWMPLSFGGVGGWRLGNTFQEAIGDIGRHFSAGRGHVDRLHALGRRVWNNLIRGWGPVVLRPSDLSAKRSFRPQPAQ